MCAPGAMLTKLFIIGLCGVIVYAVAVRFGLNGSKGLWSDPLTVALVAMMAVYTLVRVTMGPLAGPLAWAQPVAEVKSEADLDAVLANAGDEPVLVDFYAPWCMPCRATAPAVNTLASEGYRVAVVNVDDAQKLAWSYEVGTIPTILVMRGGKVTARAQGYHTAEGLRALVKG